MGDIVCWLCVFVVYGEVGCVFEVFDVLVDEVVGFVLIGLCEVGVSVMMIFDFELYCVLVDWV